MLQTSEAPMPTNDRPAWGKLCAKAALATAAGLLWTSFFWWIPASEWPVWRDVIAGLDGVLTRWLQPSSVHWLWVYRSYLMTGLFIGFLILLGHRPKALGMGHMARHGWRIVAVSYAVALPFLIALGLSSGMRQYYHAILSAPQGIDYLWASLFVITAEHALIEGGILALGLPGRGFSDFVEEPQRSGRLAFLGFGQPPGGKGFLSWLGVPAAVWPALIGQAIVFGACHVGKDFGEFLSAFPGGLGLGLLTWRVRSVWPSILLHVGTGGTILLVAYLAGL